MRGVTCAAEQQSRAACMQDFLTIDPLTSNYADVDAVMLDPSCSGSGTAATRMDHLLATKAPSMPAVDDRTNVSAADANSSTRFDALEPSSLESDLETVAQVPLVPVDEQKRVQGLAAFQKRALEHALTFPSAARVVYSTCSVYLEENEGVVAAVLPTAEAAGFSLMHALPQWHRRGAGSFSWAQKVVRVHPTIDGTDGFFVAVFERQ